MSINMKQKFKVRTIIRLNELFNVIMIKFTLISCCYLFILVLHLFINGIENQVHNIINNNNNVDTKQWMYQSEAKWDNEWKQGQWNYMEKVAVERSRIAVIGGVFIQMFTHDNASVLDIGCGEGSISDFLNNQQKSNYVGVDLSKEAIQQALKVRGSPMTFVRAAAHLYRPSSRFDAIVFSDVLYYVEYEKVLRQYKGYLNDNGIVIISIFHMSEKLMYEGIFIFARKIFDKIDEIDISGYTQKNSRSKVEKTAFHIEVYRLKPGDTLDNARGSSNVGAAVGGVGVAISSNSKVIDVGSDTSSGGIVRVDNKGSIGVEYSHVVVNSTQSDVSSTSKPVNLIDFDVINSSTGNIDNISTNSSTNNITKQQPLFYIYNLSEQYWWRWPINGSDCSGNGYVGHEHKENSGIGPLINADDGLYLTWHFSLFSSLYNRMKRSSRRTLDPSKASLFIIPYDLGLDGYLDANTCYTRRSCTNGLVGRLTTMLSHSSYFQRHDGADHVLLWSLGQYHPWPRAGCDLLMRDLCGRCTITCYWMDATKADSRFVSVPFPSAYHWWDGIRNIPWDLSIAKSRNLTAVYLGSIQTLNPTHTKIRRAMTTQCNASTECHWLKIDHSSKDMNIADYLSVYKKAVFCLCPPGDDPARKAVSDSIVSGCIPVIFEFRTLYDQYPWHLTEREALDISVYIPGGDVRSGQLDFMTVLLGISSDVIKMKQEALAMIAPRIQYAMPPPEYLVDRYDETIWDPPFKDGVELIIDGLFKRANDVTHNRSTGIPHRLMSGRAWGNEYSNVRIQIPNSNYSHQYLNHQKKYVDYHKNRLNFHSSSSGSGSRNSIGGRKGYHQGGNQSRNKIHHPYNNIGNMINKDNKRIIGATHDFNNNNNNNNFPEGVMPHHPQHLQYKAKKMNNNNNNNHENSIKVGDNDVINNAHITDSTGTITGIQIGGGKGSRHVKRLPIMEGPGEGEVSSDT